MNLDHQLSQRLYEWRCRTVDHMPLRLTDLPLEDIPVDRIPDGVKGLNLSRTYITDPYYPARLPCFVRSLQHHQFQGSTLQGLHLTDLENLVLEDCPHLESLGPLPLTLKKLTVYRCPKFRTLPEFLPPELEWLIVDDCPLFRTLPPLPPTLKELRIMNTGVDRLPPVPDDIENAHIPIDCFQGRLLNFHWTINRMGWPSMKPTMHNRIDLLTSMSRTHARMKTLKEELVSVMWHPRRVESWLLQGEEVLDMMMGC